MSENYSRMNKLYFQNPVTVNGVCYFASDFHFGAPSDKYVNEEREQRVLTWLDTIMQDATHIFFLGDLFDFWFEYKDVVPRGYYRLFNKFAELKQKNIQVYYFTGNHDMWIKNYFEEEFGFIILRKPQAFIINGKKCLVGHGDGLGPKDYGYKIIKRIFAFKPNIVFFGALHPRISFAIARFFSRKSRAMTAFKNEYFLGIDKEFLVLFAQDVLEREKIDYFIFGHRHLPLQIPLTDNAIYWNTGDWIIHDSYLKISRKNTVLVTPTVVDDFL